MVLFGCEFFKCRYLLIVFKVKKIMNSLAVQKFISPSVECRPSQRSKHDSNEDKSRCCDPKSRHHELLWCTPQFEVVVKG